MKFIPLLAVIAASLATSVQAETYGFDPGEKRDTVRFRSTAKLEFLEGSTTDLRGGFIFHPEQPGLPVSGVLRVDLRTLKTGIETRDGHMRDRHLHTDKYPYAFFELTGIDNQPPSYAIGTTYNVDVKGNFYIHGVKGPLTAKAEVVRTGKGDVFDARILFSIKLEDYTIPRPKALFLKLAETIEVELKFRARSESPMEDISLPDWRFAE